MRGPRSLYIAAVGLSAALLFLVQPMVGKMLLPRLGGSPLVWNTCMLFFQTALLAGYAYSHLLARFVQPRLQVFAHLPVLALPLLALPLGVRAGEPAGDASPVGWLLVALATSVGLPFFALSTTGPLLQRWFAWTKDPDAADPYFLYAVSNVGSLAALLAYPTIVEPNLRLVTPPFSQAGVWSGSYAAFALLTIACGLVLWRTGTASDPQPKAMPDKGGKRGERDDAARHAPIDNRRRALWTVLAFCPSAAMLGVTQFITTDLAAIPLLWIVPLSIYLITFILAFLKRPPIPLRVSGIAAAVLVVLTMASFGLRGLVPLEPLVALHLLTLFAVGLLCHGRLAADRPQAEHLTEFYLLIGLGGALGGVFSALVAPVVFDTVIEYPLTLLLACLLRPSALEALRDRAGRRFWLDLAVPAGIGAVAAVLVVMSWSAGPQNAVTLALTAALVPAALVLATLTRPLRLALGVAVLLAAVWVPARGRMEVLHQERTFFGVHRVTRFEPKRSTQPGAPQFPAVHNLYHGTTKHGAQILQERLRKIPTLYFHPDGPIGTLFRRLGTQPGLRVAVVGLGAGTLSAYGRPGQEFTFYEIDPAVARIARDARYFTYMSESQAKVDVVLGDGRLAIAHAPDASFDLIVMDAFSSDSLPVHLITREAFEVYLRKLRLEGVLALNFTNSYVDLEAVLDALTQALHLHGVVWRDRAPMVPRQILEGKVPSTWAFVTRDAARLAALGFPTEADRLPRSPGAVPDPRFLWTDDYSNLIAVLRKR